MKIKVVVHEAEEGGYWAEVPLHPGMCDAGRVLRGAAGQPVRSGGGLPLRRCPGRRCFRQGQSVRNCGMKSVSGKRFCRVARIAGMAVEANQRKPSHICQDRNARPNLRPGPW